MGPTAALAMFGPFGGGQYFGRYDSGDPMIESDWCSDDDYEGEPDSDSDRLSWASSEGSCGPRLTSGVENALESGMAKTFGSIFQIQMTPGISIPMSDVMTDQQIAWTCCISQTATRNTSFRSGAV